VLLLDALWKVLAITYRPPYNAKNINELKVMINKENYDFPRAINNISEMSKNLIRKMLKANPKERMSW
jgi:serine/threonine protein kinase